MSALVKFARRFAVASGLMSAAVGEDAGQRKRRAARHHGFGVVGHDGLVGGKAEAFGEHVDERGIEREWSALENDGRLNVDTLRKAAERLLGDGVECR